MPFLDLLSAFVIPHEIVTSSLNTVECESYLMSSAKIHDERSGPPSLNQVTSSYWVMLFQSLIIAGIKKTSFECQLKKIKKKINRNKY